MTLYKGGLRTVLLNLSHSFGLNAAFLLAYKYLKKGKDTYRAIYIK